MKEHIPLDLDPGDQEDLVCRALQEALVGLGAPGALGYHGNQTSRPLCVQGHLAEAGKKA